jgi:Gas vesicle protein
MRRREEQAMEILAGADQSLLDVIDHVLNKGVLVSGEAILGVAGVDLIYLRLSALLCAADRVQPRGREK